MGSLLDHCTATDNTKEPNESQQSNKNREKQNERSENQIVDQETDKSEQQKLLENERLENERIEKEKLEAQKVEAERLERERIENEKLEKERLKQQKLETERLEKERLDRERQAAEQARKEQEERERLEAEKLEKEKLEQERLERERIENERLEQQRIENERLEQERIAAEKAQKEKEERERLEREAAEKARKEQEERERLEREAAEKARKEEEERLNREREERERLEREAAEQARKEQEERERLEREAADKARKEEEERQNREREERERQEKEAAEKARKEQEERLRKKLERERIRKERRMKVEKERIQRQKEMIEKKKFIDLETVLVIEGYVRRFKVLTPKDIIDSILFFYTEPLIMNIKHYNNTKSIWYLPSDPSWKTLQNNIMNTFELHSDTMVKHLEYKHGIVTESDWNNCRWETNDIFTFAVLTKIEQTCVAIGRYYKYFEVEYDNLFSNFCEDNGFADDDEVEEELSAGAEDAQIIEFDEDFPFPEYMENKDDDAKLQFMYDVINNCWQNTGIQWTKLSFSRNATKVKVVKLPEVDKRMFEITKKDMAATSALYSKQCDSLWNLGMKNDHNMCIMAAIGVKYKFEYFRHLIDNYTCDRIDDMKDECALTEDEWWKGHTHNRKLKKIQMDKKDNTAYIKLQSTPNKVALSVVETFTRKYCPKLSLIPIAKINDSMEITIKYIHSMVKFIHNLINSDRFIDTNVCPFQIDLCFASGMPAQQNNEVKIFDSESEDSEEEEEKKDNDFVDYIGNIKQKLEKFSCLYVSGQCESNIEQETRTNKLNTIFETFIEKLGNSENKNEYPNRKRFITFIDRRNINKKTLDSMDPVWMYTPPENCRTMPEKNVLAEWYINASKTCLLPNTEHNPNQIDDIPNSNEPNINSTFHCKGALLTISFCVQEYDAISMYLYWNGQMTRLLPRFIKPIFNSIYNLEKYSNQTFIETGNIDELIEDIGEIVSDKYYDMFCKTYC